jgi:hypothetical protein
MTEYANHVREIAQQSQGLGNVNSIASENYEKETRNLTQNFLAVNTFFVTTPLKF